MRNSQKLGPECSFETSERNERAGKAEGTEDTEDTEKAEGTDSRVNPFLRVILLMAGTLFVAIGVLGIYLPVLPTTPFLLLAAACYVRGSKRMYHWLLAQPRLGWEMRRILEKRGLPPGVKVFSLAVAWLVLGSVALFMVESSWAKALLIALALIKTGVLMRMPTAK